tara:strand:- start:433 stop:618 length:186 start_codon:yes stop_codon:yes gene_type:complete
MDDLESLPWAEGCDPSIRRNREHKRKVKVSNRNSRQRKKKRDVVDDYNEHRPAGTLRKFYT